ncbi:hypothetical protein [Okeania sp. SIO2B3]|nr:hypothetical protein [Okeania sp. SIO2B3]NET45567.1 hypothetical protein [Okeania sp. SIO2B3]
MAGIFHKLRDRAFLKITYYSPKTNVTWRGSCMAGIFHELRDRVFYSYRI